jgi:hypothetical protein
MDRSQVIADTLRKLHIEDYRETFRDSVLSLCRAALDDFDASGREFWNAMCCGRQADALREFMDNDQDLMDYYIEVCNIASGPGSFMMPEWGTRGT